MDPATTAAVVGGPISAYGTRYMLDSEMYADLDQWGYAGLDFYFCGRGGVLGDAPADAVVAAFGFMHVDMVRSMWEAGREVAPVATTVRRFADRCADWGRRHFDPSVDLDRLADLAVRVVDGADMSGAPLAAGWRAVERPADGAGNTALLLQTLREHRGGMHLMAVRAAGLRPLDAVLVNGGHGVARFFGHSPPFPDLSGRDDITDAVAVAEATTELLAAQPYGMLDEAERAEFAELVVALHDRLR